MRTVLRSYEPVFGGIVSVLAAALLCAELYVSFHHGPDSATRHLMAYSGAALAWGLLQIVGYRNAKRSNIAIGEPTLTMPLGCVLIGLLLALLTVCLFEFAQNSGYAFAAGIAAAALLCVGTVAGIRQGTWK